MAEATETKAEETTEKKSETVETKETPPAQTEETPKKEGATLVTKSDPKAESSKDEKSQEPVVPEKYDLKLPDGSALDPDAIEKTAAYARERGFSNEEAQGLLERENLAVSQYQARQQAMLTEQSEVWVNEVKDDKELGGDNFGKSVETAKRVIDHFGSESFRRALDQSGLGNHPEVIRIFKRIGEKASDDMLVVPSPQSAPPKKVATADLIYDKTAEKKE